MALTKMVEVGDRIRDSEGDEWTITRVRGGLAWYDKYVHSVFDNVDSPKVHSIFIAQFDENSKGVLTFNKNMTLIE